MHETITAAPQWDEETAAKKSNQPHSVYRISGETAIRQYTAEQMTTANRNPDGTYSGHCAGCDRQTICISASGQFIGRDCRCVWLPGDSEDEPPPAGETIPTSKPTCTPDEAAVRRFLELLIGEGGGYYELRAFPESEKPLPPAMRSWFQSPEEAAPIISNCVRRGLHVYVGVAARQDRKGGKAALIYTDWLFAELDFKDFPGGEPEARARVAAYPRVPTMVIASGGGLQLYWHIERTSLRENVSRVEAVLKRFVDDLEADSAATDASRILRVPGTWNVKHRYGSPRPVVLEVAPEGKPRPYRLAGFPVAVKEAHSKPKAAPGAAPSGCLLPDDARLLDKARHADNGEKFTALFDRGDISAHSNDHSAADLALCSLLLFWTGGDCDRAERLFNQSALGQRDKWRERADYRQRTIKQALSGKSTSYNPGRKSVVPLPDASMLAETPTKIYGLHPWTADTWEQWAKDAIKRQDAQNEEWRWQWAAWYVDSPFPEGKKEEIAASIFGEDRWRTFRNYGTTLTAWRGIDRRGLNMSKCTVLNPVPDDIKREFAARCYEEGLTVKRIRAELIERGLLKSKPADAWTMLKEKATHKDEEHLKYLIDTEGTEKVLNQLRRAGVLPARGLPQGVDDPEWYTSRCREVDQEAEDTETRINETETPHDIVRSDAEITALHEEGAELHDNIYTVYIYSREVAPLDAPSESSDSARGQISTPKCAPVAEPETPSSPQEAAPEESAPAFPSVSVTEPNDPLSTEEESERLPILFRVSEPQMEEARRTAQCRTEQLDRFRKPSQNYGKQGNQHRDCCGAVGEYAVVDYLRSQGFDPQDWQPLADRPVSRPDFRLDSLWIEVKASESGHRYACVNTEQTERFREFDPLVYLFAAFSDDKTFMLYGPVFHQEVLKWEQRTNAKNDSRYYSCAYENLPPLTDLEVLRRLVESARSPRVRIPTPTFRAPENSCKMRPLVTAKT